MSETHIPSMLLSLQDKLIGYVESKKKERVQPNEAHSSRALPLGMKPELIGSTSNIESASERSTLPPRPDVKEPYSGAWLKVGDKCEGNVEGQTDGKSSRYRSRLFFLFSYF